MTKRKIKSIELNLSSGYINLSLEEARELYEELHDLFAKSSVTLPPNYNVPHIREDIKFPPDIYKVTCTDLDSQL